jgi:hypothetical protein
MATTCGLLGLALGLDPVKGLSHLASAVVVFVAIPWVIASCLGAVCVPLCGFAVAVAVPVKLVTLGRPTGASGLIREALALPCAVVPGYYRVLFAVRSPIAWGFALGAVAATVLLAVAVVAGFVPVSGAAPP